MARRCKRASSPANATWPALARLGRFEGTAGARGGQIRARTELPSGRAARRTAARVADGATRTTRGGQAVAVAVGRGSRRLRRPRQDPALHMPIYTKTGDAGHTGLFGNRRVRKHDPRIETYG